VSGRILVLGAAGRIGRAAAEAFRDTGWSVASQVRGTSAPRAAAGTQIVEVDARDAESLVEADLAVYRDAEALTIEGSPADASDNPRLTQWINPHDPSVG